MQVKSAGELDNNEELDEQMRAVLMRMKCSRSHLIISRAESHSFPVFLSLMFCTVLFCLAVHVLSLYKHNYGTIVLGREGCCEVQDCKFCFGPKYIFFQIASLASSTPLNIPSDHTKQFLDITTQATNISGCPPASKPNPAIYALESPRRWKPIADV